MYSWDYLVDNSVCTVDGRRFRDALGVYPTGVCIVTTEFDGKREGMTINSFASVSLSPPLVLWSIRNDAKTIDAFYSSPFFAINILSVEQKVMAQHFSRPAKDKFEAFEEDFQCGANNVPILPQAAAVFECKTYSRHQEGDHTVIVGRVDKFSKQSASPLLFFGGMLGSIEEISAYVGSLADDVKS